MNIEDRIARAAANGNAREMDQILNSQLEQGADHAQLVAFVHDQHELLRFFGGALATQGATILELRRKIIELEGDMARAGIGGKEPTGLVGFDQPKLEVN
jgi:hypothetical protein